ncbi:MAG: hypothetical protein F4X99_22700 [Gammaproteobacteria bacterium]|nr:hypothetical protein [Gammaproteobacteria bacterium]MYE82708.1 hypothetical protein [Gammaproteobacteria bacterium]
MTNLKKKTIAAALSAAFVAAMSGATVSADENPFSSETEGYDLLVANEEGEGEGEGQCGEGQCGEGDKDDASDEEA